MTTKREIYNDGKERGECVASWLELPDLGTKVWSELNGNVTLDKDNYLETMIDLALDNEQHDRQYSPFEDTAKELNELNEVKPYDVWEIYESGIDKGILDELKPRVKDWLKAKQ
jgi:hypothetical protein